MRYIGVDPGKSGGISCITTKAVDEIVNVGLFSMRDKTDHDIWNWLRAITQNDLCCALLENVHAMPGQGVTSMFTFGDGLGFVRGLLVASGVKINKITPQAWQKAMGCRTKGDKSVSLAAAQRMYPEISGKITLATADSLLIATYCKRFAKDLFP